MMNEEYKFALFFFGMFIVAVIGGVAISSAVKNNHEYRMAVLEHETIKLNCIKSDTAK